MLLTAPDIESTSQEEINDTVKRMLETVTGGGGRPPEIWDNGGGGGGDDDEPDNSSNKRKWDPNLLYLAAWGITAFAALVALTSIYDSPNKTQQTPAMNEKLPVTIKSYNQTRPRLDLWLSNSTPLHPAVKTSQFEACAVSQLHP